MRLASAQRARSGYREGIDDMATHPDRAHGRTSKPPLRGRILTLCSLLWLVAPAAAEMAPQGVRGHCEIRFIGSSTLHDFSGEVRSQPFGLEVPPVLGLISVGDAVQVRAHVILDALAGAQPETTLLDGPLESSASGS